MKTLATVFLKAVCNKQLVSVLLKMQNYSPDLAGQSDFYSRFIFDHVHFCNVDKNVEVFVETLEK